MPLKTITKAIRNLQTEEIKASFAELEIPVFTTDDLFAFIDEHRLQWNFGKSWNLKFITNLLSQIGCLTETSLLSDQYPKRLRYVGQQASDFQIALSLVKGAYISHGTAASLHGLMPDWDNSTIYINKEQSPKFSAGILTQENIDRAFSGGHRQSNYRYRCLRSSKRTEYVIVSGKHSQSLGVNWISHPNAGRILMTNLERTLVDIVVRPQYSGGPRALLKAYTRAMGRADVAALAQILQRLEFVYPYHQAAGFLMTKAGFQRSQLKIFKEPGLRFNFYLAHGMPDKLYDSEWKLFYPANLESR